NEQEASVYRYLAAPRASTTPEFLVNLTGFTRERRLKTKTRQLSGGRDGEMKQIRYLAIYTLLLASVGKLHAGASGGGGLFNCGPVTPGPGPSFTQFDLANPAPPASIAAVQALAASMPQYAIELNALLAGPTDGTYILNWIGFSNGTSQPQPSPSSGVFI